MSDLFRSLALVRRGFPAVNTVLLLVILTFTVSGCSKNDWIAKILMLKAENAYQRGSELRLKKVTYEERLAQYKDACDNFKKAYEYNPRVFTLNRIESAADSCSRVGDYDGENGFREYAAKYTKEHPKETSYGDAFPMSDM